MPPRRARKCIVQADSERFRIKVSDSPTTSSIEDIPLEVLGEIISHLEPLDVLQLARTNKHMRALLMSRSMASYWKCARNNVKGLPPCPIDLSEPAYAYLMFTSHCHKCFAEDEDVLTHVEARVQLCYKCTLKEFKKWKGMPEKIDQKLVDFIPATSEALTVAERKQPEHTANTQWKIAARTRFHVETALRLQKQFDELRTPTEKERWLEEQRAAWSSIDEHATLCRDFERGDLPRDGAEAYKFLMERRSRIYQKLSDLGYEHEIDRCRSLSNTEAPLMRTMYPLIWKAKKLTDEEWQTLEEPMIAWMEQVRSALLAQHDAELLHNWVAARLTPPYTEYILAAATALPLPTLKQLALADTIKPHLPSNGGALDDYIPSEALQEAIAQIPEIMRSYASDVEEYLLDLVRRATLYHGKTIDRNALFYATTMFRCTTCKASFAFPDVLAHVHFYKDSYALERHRPASRVKAEAEANIGESDTEAGIHFAFKEYRIWAPGRAIRFNEAAYHHTLIVLNSLQLDSSTTSQTLRDLNPYVELLCKCSPKPSAASGRNRLVNRWSEVIQMVELHRHMDYDNTLRVFNEADIQQVRGYQPRVTPPLNWSPRTTCPYCGCHTVDPYHFSRQHGLSEGDAATVFRETPKEWSHGTYRSLMLP